MAKLNNDNSKSFLVHSAKKEIKNTTRNDVRSPSGRKTSTVKTTNAALKETRKDNLRKEDNISVWCSQKHYKKVKEMMGLITSFKATNVNRSLKKMEADLLKNEMKIFEKKAKNMMRRDKQIISDGTLKEDLASYLNIILKYENNFRNKYRYVLKNDVDLLLEIMNFNQKSRRSKWPQKVITSNEKNDDTEKEARRRKPMKRKAERDDESISMKGIKKCKMEEPPSKAKKVKNKKLKSTLSERTKSKNGKNMEKNLDENFRQNFKKFAATESKTVISADGLLHWLKDKKINVSKKEIYAKFKKYSGQVNLLNEFQLKRFLEEFALHAHVRYSEMYRDMSMPD